MQKKIFYLLVALSLALVPTAFALSATTVGNDVSIGATLDVTGATTLDGAVTLGDAYADNITVTGRIASALWASSTLYVGSTMGGEDLVVTNNAVTVGTSVNTSTLAVFGNTTLTGSLLPQTAHNNNYDLGAYDRAWKNVFVSGTAYLGVIDNGVSTNDDGIVVNASLDSGTNNGLSLGSWGSAWRDMFASGTVYADAITMNKSSGTSTIILSTQATNVGTCFVVKDTAGTAKYMTILTGNTVNISTVDCRN